MSAALLDEAADYLATFAEEDERARELSQRLALAAEGIAESWPVSTERETVEWMDPETGRAVVAQTAGDGWDVALLAPGSEEAKAGARVESLAKAAGYARERLG